MLGCLVRVDRSHRNKLTGSKDKERRLFLTGENNFYPVKKSFIKQGRPKTTFHYKNFALTDKKCLQAFYAVIQLDVQIKHAINRTTVSGQIFTKERNMTTEHNITTTAQLLPARPDNISIPEWRITLGATYGHAKPEVLPLVLRVLSGEITSYKASYIANGDNKIESTFVRNETAINKALSELKQDRPEVFDMDADIELENFDASQWRVILPVVYATTKPNLREYVIKILSGELTAYRASILETGNKAKETTYKRNVNKIKAAIEKMQAEYPNLSTDIKF